MERGISIPGEAEVDDVQKASPIRFRLQSHHEVLRFDVPKCLLNTVRGYYVPVEETSVVDDFEAVEALDRQSAPRLGAHVAVEALLAKQAQVVSQQRHDHVAVATTLGGDVEVGHVGLRAVLVHTIQYRDLNKWLGGVLRCRHLPRA